MHAPPPPNSPYGAPPNTPYVGPPQGGPGYPPPGMGQAQREKISSTMLMVIVGAGLCFFLVVVGLVVFGWSSFVQFGVTSDLGDYRRDIAGAEFEDESERQALVDRLDAVRDQVRDGDISPSLFQWIPHDEAIESALLDGYVDVREVRELHGEFEQIETY